MAPQLYLITPANPDPASFPAVLMAVLKAAEVSALLVRRGSADEAGYAKRAREIINVGQGAGCAVLLEDDATLAKRLGADGVHLGQKDGDPREARDTLGPSVQIGVTCHDSRHLAMEAGEKGADYVAFGAFYETTTKPSNYRPKPELLSWWASLFEVPCVAIGGITPLNAAPLVTAGADFIAVCQAVWGSGDPASEVAKFEALFTA